MAWKKLPETDYELLQKKWATCKSSGHLPSADGLEPGRYEHTCRACGMRSLLTIPWRGHMKLETPLG